MDTAKLIRQLTESSDPIRLLCCPWRRTAEWLGLSLPYLVIVVTIMSPREDLTAKLADLRFVIEQLSAFATGVTAAIAAFATVIPGYNRKILLLPVLPLVVWLGSFGGGCLADWLRLGAAALRLQADWMCIPSILLVGAVPALAMVAMLRKGAPLRPYLACGLGGLAAAGLGQFGLRFFHVQDASLTVLIWQIGTVLSLSMLASAAGSWLLNWRHLLDGARYRISRI